MHFSLNSIIENLKGEARFSGAYSKALGVEAGDIGGEFCVSEIRMLSKYNKIAKE